MAQLPSMMPSRNGTTHLADDWEALVKFHGIDVIAECTGNPVAAVEHCLAAFYSPQTHHQRNGRSRCVPLRPDPGPQGEASRC